MRFDRVRSEPAITTLHQTLTRMTADGLLRSAGLACVAAGAIVLAVAAVAGTRLPHVND